MNKHMEFVSDWLELHYPDSYKRILCEPDCGCGIEERHSHCSHCGKLTSIGDWGAPPIAEFTLVF